MKFLLTLVVLYWAHISVADKLPMPPVFDLERDGEVVVREYPLGVITALAAHSHHGHPDHKITLPNGLEGWVYELYGGQELRKYIGPDGTKHRVKEATQSFPISSFVLVFDTQRKVVDVLYDSKRPKSGLSALQVQRRINPQKQKLPSLEHGAHFSPGGSRERY